MHSTIWLVLTRSMLSWPMSRLAISEPDIATPVKRAANAGQTALTPARPPALIATENPGPSERARISTSPLLRDAMWSARTGERRVGSAHRLLQTSVGKFVRNIQKVSALPAPLL